MFEDVFKRSRGFEGISFNLALPLSNVLLTPAIPHLNVYYSIEESKQILTPKATNGKHNN